MYEVLYSLVRFPYSTEDTDGSLVLVVEVEGVHGAHGSLVG